MRSTRFGVRSSASSTFRRIDCIPSAASTSIKAGANCVGSNSSSLSIGPILSGQLSAVSVQLLHIHTEAASKPPGCGVGVVGLLYTDGREGWGNIHQRPELEPDKPGMKGESARRLKPRATTSKVRLRGLLQPQPSPRRGTSLSVAREFIRQALSPEILPIRLPLPLPTRVPLSCPSGIDITERVHTSANAAGVHNKITGSRWCPYPGIGLVSQPPNLYN